MPIQSTYSSETFLPLYMRNGQRERQRKRQRTYKWFFPIPNITAFILFAYWEDNLTITTFFGHNVMIETIVAQNEKKLLHPHFIGRFGVSKEKAGLPETLLLKRGEGGTVEEVARWDFKKTKNKKYKVRNKQDSAVEKVWYWESMKIHILTLDHKQITPNHTRSKFHQIKIVSADESQVWSSWSPNSTYLHLDFHSIAYILGCLEKHIF